MIIDLTVREIRDLAEATGLLTIAEPECDIDEEDLDTVICLAHCHPDGLENDEGVTEHFKLVMYFEDCPEEGVIPLGKPTEGDVMKGIHNAITICRWWDAPEALRELSTNGGDEDWVAVVPPALADAWIPWMDEGSSFGCCDVSEYPHPDLPGHVVKIGSHA